MLLTKREAGDDDGNADEGSGMPQRNAQKKTANRTRNGEIDNALPTKRGSR